MWRVIFIYFSPGGEISLDWMNFHRWWWARSMFRSALRTYCIGAVDEVVLMDGSRFKYGDGSACQVKLEKSLGAVFMDWYEYQYCSGVLPPVV